MLEQVRVLEQVRALAQVRELEQVRALARAQAQAQALERVQALERAQERVRALEPGQALERALVLEPGRGHSPVDVYRQVPKQGRVRAAATMPHHGTCASDPGRSTSHRTMPATQRIRSLRS